MVWNAGDEVIRPFGIGRGSGIDDDIRLTTQAWFKDFIEATGVDLVAFEHVHAPDIQGFEAGQRSRHRIGIETDHIGIGRYEMLGYEATGQGLAHTAFGVHEEMDFWSYGSRGLHVCHPVK
jgi:hypothetical protein